MGVCDTAVEINRGTISNYDLLEDITLTKPNEYIVGMNSELGISISVYSITCRFSPTPSHVTMCFPLSRSLLFVPLE